MQKLLLPLGIAAVMAWPVYASAQATFVISPSVVAVKESTGSLTLAAALELAFATNPELSAATHEVLASEGALRQAGIIPNPEFEAVSEDRRRELSTTTMQITLPIELGGKRSARIKAAEGGRESARAELNVKRAEIRAAVITAFFDLLTAQERYHLAETSLALAKDATLAASRRVTAGKVSPVEESKARIAEAGVSLEFAQAKSELLQARMRLAATWGSTAPSFTEVKADPDEMPAIPDFGTLARQVSAAPGVLLAKAEVARREAMTNVERSRRFPDLRLSAGVKRDAQLGRDQTVMGISIPLPFFDRNQGNLQEALQKAERARDELAVAEVRNMSELAQAHSRHVTARTEVKTLQQDVLPSALSAFDAATKGFALGKFNFLDVLDAQRTLLQTRSQYLRAMAETYRSAAEIERIVGIPVVGVASPTRVSKE